ncbi:unnamed protein product [Callosobruchus maculatus]|uniref:Peptidase S1 domain-containing protein n=1 Tax=Callosobruchus maculatus TaxID=64391 RepID=A0A653DGW7_CALMS|nr:unnamed protein product [Callosobruchus maculatus]
MRCINFFLLCALTYHATILASDLVTAIAGGHDTQISRHRGIVSLQRDGRHICGAGLISVNWLLTSAKCVALGPQHLSVHAGSNTTDGTRFEVEKVILHPDYKPAAHDADIALLYVKENITDTNFTSAYLLPYGKTEEIPEEAHCHLIGWGKLANGSYPRDLQMGYVIALSREVCRKHYSQELITMDMFCVASNLNTLDHNTIAACQGDFGGPVVCYATGLVGIQGIASWGMGCRTTNNKPTVITKVYSYVKWIRNVTGIKEPF